jgi:hypothetical protein
MATMALVTVEGVLTKSDDLRSAMPTKWAKALYDGLRSQANIVVLTRADTSVAQWWLKREHLNGWSGIHVYPLGSNTTWEHWRLDKLRGFLAEGWEVFAFVDGSLDLIEAARDMGVMGIYIAYPSMPPGWQETTAPRAWTDIVATVESTA